MNQITSEQAAALRGWFVPDQPGPLVGLHLIQTGSGACHADRWPDPRAVLVEAGGNYSLLGDPQALEPADLVHRINGLVDAPEEFVPLLKAAFPALAVWERVTLALDNPPDLTRPSAGLTRRIEADDAPYLSELSPELTWIWDTWGDASRLASSGHAWGAFTDDRLVSVACTFFVGERYEEVGVVTEPEFRGMGLSVACAGALCADIQGRGRIPSWSTSPDNTPSLRVAQKLGFEVRRRSRLYIVGMPVPEPARRDPAA